MSPATEFQCCCGRHDCAYLEHNIAALHGLERDVRSAAQAGQALLVRHEAYMADAEEERRKMLSHIERLETEKRTLDAANTKNIAENRKLLNELEEFNNAVVESDAQIISLTKTLEASKEEIQRLTVLADRTSELEAHLSVMELEHANLRDRLLINQAEERSAIQRWKQAERAVGSLQDQIDKVEREAGQERERHNEVVIRMERQMAVDRELENAAGRLKRAAALSTLERNSFGSHVVSHFVKDILQDNANLQQGIIELRDMLKDSNEEVEILRGRMPPQQPTMSEQEGVHRNVTLQQGTLDESTKEITPALHVHHHYHPPVTEEAFRAMAPPYRRPKKKRSIIAPGFSATQSGKPTPRLAKSIVARSAPISSPAFTLSQTSSTVPTPSFTRSPSQSRPSMQSRSSLISSSVLSSPQSAYQPSSMFDHAENPFGSSPPTSPESNSPDSPKLYSHRRRNNSDISHRSEPPTTFQVIPEAITQARIREDRPDTGNGRNNENRTVSTEMRLSNQVNLSEQIERGAAADSSIAETNSQYSIESEYFASAVRFQPMLHRSASHESLLSVSGMDIHTTRPSQKIMGSQAFTLRHPSAIAPPSPAFASSKATISATTATGRPSYQKRAYDISSYNRSLLSHAIGNDAGNTTDKLTLGKRMGDWVWGKWGVFPTASTSTLRAKVALSDIDEKPAVMQVRTKSGVEPTKVNTLLLEEALGE